MFYFVVPNQSVDLHVFKMEDIENVTKATLFSN